MRGAPTILHLDMDAFFAAVEQAAKPSLRGKPVVVGGIGPRGVVATASYEARIFGIHSAMATGQARRLCPNAAYLAPRFTVYREVSEAVMELLHGLSPLVEPLSLDEAFVDLEAGGTEPSSRAAHVVGERLRRDIRAVTGLTGSVGLAGSKMLAKIASEQAKPDGLVLIPPGTERDLLAPMTVRTLPGVGPATAEHLRRAGVHTVGEMAEAGEDELVRLLGRAHGSALHAMALGLDDRPVIAERDAKSVSVEDTFDVDLHDRERVRSEVRRLADRCVRRLRAAGRSGRTVVLKVRRYDFSTLTRSETLRGPTDDPAVIREAAARLLEVVDTTGGVRLLGVGVSGLADFTQEDLFAQVATAEAAGDAADTEAAGASEAVVPGAVGDPRPGGSQPAGSQDVSPGGSTAVGPEQPGDLPPERPPGEPEPRRWVPGHDVRHAELGSGWVQGSGLGRVTVRFEDPWSPPGRVRTFAADDQDLQPSEPITILTAGRVRAPGPDAETPAQPEPPAESEPPDQPDADDGTDTLGGTDTSDGPDAYDEPHADGARHAVEDRRDVGAADASRQSPSPAIRPKSRPSDPPPPGPPAPPPASPPGAVASMP